MKVSFAAGLQKICFRIDHRDLRAGDFFDVSMSADVVYVGVTGEQEFYVLGFKSELTD